MWPDNYETRLADWHHLRTNLKDLPLEVAAHTVNDWWFRAPFVSHYLDYDNWKSWPTPWELLADNDFCDIARALGILYTITMSEHTEVKNISLVKTENDNLVLINNGKYMLNWAPHKLLNIESTNIAIQYQIDGALLQQQLG